MEKAYPDISCAHAAKMLSLKEGETCHFTTVNIFRCLQSTLRIGILHSTKEDLLHLWCHLFRM